MRNVGWSSGSGSWSSRVLMLGLAVARYSASARSRSIPSILDGTDTLRLAAVAQLGFWVDAEVPRPVRVSAVGNEIAVAAHLDRSDRDLPLSSGLRPRTASVGIMPRRITSGLRIRRCSHGAGRYPGEPVAGASDGVVTAKPSVSARGCGCWADRHLVHASRRLSGQVAFLSSFVAAAPSPHTLRPRPCLNLIGRQERNPPAAS